jgi:hypothetical protein
VHVWKNQSEEIANLQAEKVTWYENSPIPDYYTPSSLKEKNTCLEAIQEGICSVAEKKLLKPKKKVSKGIYFFGAYPIPLQMLKTHLHCLVRLQMLLDHPLSCNSYKADGSLKSPRLRCYLKRLAVWIDHAKSIFDKMDHGDQLRNPINGDTAHDPEWWHTSHDVNKIRDALDTDIAYLRRRAKRQYRSIRNAIIKSNVAKRQANILTGRMRSALASLLGRHKSAFLYKTLICVDGSFDADPVKIHRRIQTHYMKYLSVITSSLI